MRGLPEPTLERSGFEDPRDIRAAVGELTDMSRMRRDAHDLANLFRDFHIAEIGGSRERQLRGELQQARGVLARWAVMAANQEFRTVDLVRVENNGDWDATAQAEAEIGDLAVELFMHGEIEGMVERDTPESRLRITVDPGMVSEKGLIAVRRKRLLLATTPQSLRFADMRPKNYLTPDPADAPRGMMTADVSLEIDKVSEFVLDLNYLRRMSPDAYEEVREATRGGEVAGEITVESSATISAAAVEIAIGDRDPILTPAITTYYADRKYRNIRKAGTEEVELVA